MLIEPDRTWVKTSMIWTLIALTVSVTAGGTLIYSQVNYSIASLSSDVSEMKETLHEVVVELRSFRTEMVSVQQAKNWIETIRVANRIKYPDLVIPDIPR